MRALAGLVIALGVLAVLPSGAAAKTHRRIEKAEKTEKGDKAAKRDRAATSARAEKTAARDDRRKSSSHAPKRAARIRSFRERERLDLRQLTHGQSIGAPWAGHLQRASELPPGDGYHIRRPERAFGTETTIELTERAITATREAFPDEHVLAIGDISAPSGGTITQHRSHQSGRDIDVGLFYLEQPAGYPANFVHADDENLDCAATFKLLESFVASADEDGGVQMIFLDFEVQGLLYDWALDHGVSERRLERIFQYPHGRDSSEGIVRHEPNHDNHMHVRFKCPSADAACR